MIRFAYAVIVLMTLFQCSKDTTIMSGGGTETGNAILTGKLVNRDGTPAANALVRFYTVSKKPMDIAKIEGEIFAVTDKEGNYSLETVADGRYNVFGSKEDNLSFRDSVQIRDGIKVKLPSDTLKPSGGITGWIKLRREHMNQAIFIMAMGTSHFTTVIDTTGHFVIKNMAAGRYAVKIQSFMPEYAPLDTHFTVTSGVVDTLKDTIRLNYSGIPVPSGLKVVYDTLNGLAKLSWNKINNADIAGYIVYRNDTSSQTPTRISGDRLISDTFYIDTVFRTGGDSTRKVFQYRLKAQNRNADQSPSYSSAITTVAEPPSTVMTTISLSSWFLAGDGKHVGTTMSIKDTLYVAATFGNPGRKLTNIRWMLNDSVVKDIVVGETEINLDTIKLSNVDTNWKMIQLQVTDNSGLKWNSIVLLNVKINAPVVTILNTYPTNKDSLWLDIYVRDQFGIIKEVALDINETGNFQIIDASQLFKMAIDSTMYNSIISCKVTDDDGNQTITTITISQLLSSSYVFWYKGKSYNIADKEGPSLPPNSIVKEGKVLSATIRGSVGSQDPYFAIGNGLDGTQARSSIVWFSDLAKATGTIRSAKLRGEYWDSWSGNGFCNAGTINLRIGVVNIGGHLDALGVTPATHPDNAVWADPLNPLASAMGYEMSGESMRAEEIKNIVVPESHDGVTPKLQTQFFSVDITTQVQWILDNSSNGGQYGIAFIVTPSDGSTGKIHLYSSEDGAITSATLDPWTMDGNTIHLLVDGILKFRE